MAKLEKGSFLHAIADAVERLGDKRYEEMSIKKAHQMSSLRDYPEMESVIMHAYADSHEKTMIRLFANLEVGWSYYQSLPER